MIELRPLSYFVAACRSETLAHAAARLEIAPSTLSTALKSLEQEIGSPLFARLGSGLCPTADACRLLRIAESLVEAESFARRWAGAQHRRRARRLKLEIMLNFTIGAVSAAVQRAIETFAQERPEILVDPVWMAEHDQSHAMSLAAEWPDTPSSRVILGFATESTSLPMKAVPLLSDRWVFAARLPAATGGVAEASALTAGRLVVPALAQPLIDQAEHYFSRHKMSGIRFVNDHPAEAPRLIDRHPDAALFVPESLIAPRLGLQRVRIVAPDPPLRMNIVARVPEPDTATTLFIRHLRKALAEPVRHRVPSPAITLRQVRYFEMVYRLRRVSAAAYGANVSQPSLTEQLHKLEAALNTALFDRHGDGVVPTASGERFARAARLIDAGVRRLTDGDAGVAAPAGRRIGFGILPSVSQHGLLVNRITEAVLGVQERHPGLKLVIQEAPNGTLQDWVVRGLVGVAIVETSLPHMPRLALGSSEGLAVIADARHGLLPAGSVKFADLASLPLALPTNRFGLRQLLDAAASEHGIAIHPRMEIDALAMTAAVLALRPVCTVLPPSAVRRELADGELVAHPIVDPQITRRLFVIYSGERALSEPERDLVHALRERLAETDEPA
jgi:DNA-binding transcriptional LysR family regulator